MPTNEHFMVSGYASVQIRDQHGDIIDIDALDRAMPKFVYENGTLNYEHSIPIGRIIRWEKTEKDGKPALKIYAVLHDNHLSQQIRKEIESGKLAAFSIRGSALDIRNGVITDLEIYEISLVYEPANPEAKIEEYKIIKSLVKSKCGAYTCHFKEKLLKSKSKSKPNSNTTFIQKIKSCLSY